MTVPSLWVLCVVLITTAAECPKGGRIHLGSWRCYWLPEAISSWPGAQDFCRQTVGGDVATADNLELQNFIHHSFSIKTTVWVWVKESAGGSGQTGTVDPVNGAWWTRGSKSEGGCPQMALGSPEQWRKAPCDAQYLFLCEKDVKESLPSVDTYLTGLLLMTSVYAQTQINLIPKVPDIGHQPVEMLLFPGMWFSHAGHLVSVELVVQPSPVSSLARAHILRPYCHPNQHLVPPGCTSLLNPFSCCSAQPLCNTTGGCSVGQYWCHLTETCLYTTSPCSPYDAATGGYTLPPRCPSTPPFYHMVADMPLRISPSSELNTISLFLKDRTISVYPDDIVALQHTRASGTFLHCLSSEASLDSPWRQSYLSLRESKWGGWWEGGLTSLPLGGQWVDGVVCDLRMLYVDSLHRGTEHDGFNCRETTTDPDVFPLTAAPRQRSNFGLTIIHPVPDENNQIHVQTNVPTLIVIKVFSGQKAWSSWSAPVHQTEVAFLPSCPDEVADSWPGCKIQSRDEWFSSVSLELPSVGVQTMNISVTDAVKSQSVRLTVCVYEAVTGLSVEPHGCPRILVKMPQSFTAKVVKGSSVKFTWVIDDLKKFAYEGDSYNVVFEEPAEYKLKVTASNPVSFQSHEILLTADDVTPLTDPEFQLARKLVAVHATHLYTLRVKVDISLPVTLIWDFGDGSRELNHTRSAPCQMMEGLVERGEKQVHVQDLVNHTYAIPGEYTLHVQVSNQYDSRDVSMKISVRPALKHLLISFSPQMPLVTQTLFLEASAVPSTSDVFYTWHFGDGSDVGPDTHHRVRHAFASAGAYNITLYANNTLTVISTWLIVEVSEEISGLVVSNNGPSELSSVTDFRATVATGTSLIWNFDFGDGSSLRNLTVASVSHVYKSPGIYTVNVAVSNSISHAHEAISIEVYRLFVSGILPTECVVSERDVRFNALVNRNISTLTFHWLFGDGSPQTIVKGQTDATHKFHTQGNFHINLTVFSSVTSASFNTTLCVEVAIGNITMQLSEEVAAVGEEVCLSVIVFPEQMTGYRLKWFTSSLSRLTRTENSQRCFIFEEEGVEQLSVTASNRVNNKTAKANITIQNRVEQLTVAHDGQSDTMSLNTGGTFWVASCLGSNVSVVWDFGDGSPLEQTTNVSHVFTSTGRFSVTATAFNLVSRVSVTLNVNVLLPVSNLSILTEKPHAVVGEEMVFSAITSAVSSSSYSWFVDGKNSCKPETYQLRFTFLKPGVRQVKVVAQNPVSRKEAAILIEVFERIEGLQINCQCLINMKYVSTHQKLLFSPSINKGSNVTYHWLTAPSKIDQQIIDDGESFQMLAETPGEISIYLRASNKLGEATASLFLVAVERVKGANITTQSNTLALGKVVNISVTVLAGSDLQYLWYMKPDHSLLQTRVPFLLHTFTSVGHCLVGVSVQNVLSQSHVTKELIIQEEIQEVDFQIEGETRSFYIATAADVTVHGLIRSGSNLRWSWKVTAAMTEISSITNQTFIYSFPHAGVYQASLNVSNEINWQTVSHSVTVQDAIKDLILNISKSSFCSGEQVTFISAVSKGSNLSHVITFRTQDWTYSQDIPEGKFTTSSLPAGTHLVTLKAWNQVSRAEVSSSIQVFEDIEGLRIVNCCSAAVEAQKGIKFKSEIQNGLPVNYNWTFHLAGYDPMWIGGQEVIFTPPGSGSLSVSTLAANGVCTKSANGTITVQWPVKKANLVCHSERIFVGHVAIFSAEVITGSNLTFLWDFGDSTETLVTHVNTVSYTYYTSGTYRIMVTVLNDVSRTSVQLHTEVEELQCSTPKVSLVQSQSNIFRSRSSYFEATVDTDCSIYRTRYLWEILTESDCTNSTVRLSGNKVNLRCQDATSLTLFLPKHMLSVGQYCLVFTVSLQETPLLVQQKAAISVVSSPLVAAIKGGSKRLWPGFTDLILDGSESQDPDMVPGEEAALQYDWILTTLNSPESGCIKKQIGSNSSRVTVLGAQLHPGTVYIFTLTVHKAGRTPASANQTVTVCESPVLPVTVGCASCSAHSPHHTVSQTLPIVLSGQCGQCDSQAEYIWSAEDQTGVAVDLDKIITTAERNSPNLEVPPGVLRPGHFYTFILNISQHYRGQWGSASVTILPNTPPHGGLCDLSPDSDIHLLETVVTYNCSGWQHDGSRASQLVYTFQVAPCQPSGTKCPLLTLYRGTRSTFGSLLPMGSIDKERNTSVITVTLLVEDHLGTTTVALKRILTVKNRVRDDAASQWLRNKSETELCALVQYGNPHQIIPYSIALTSQLNQLESGMTAKDLVDRREIRKNVTEALTALPVSSLLDVEQISSALLQSTAVPNELVCEDCQNKVLETVGKMIHIIEEQIGPGFLSAAQTGSNILSIIGSTLAAASESVRASSSHPPALSTTLSALAHVGTLMRSLMHFHVQGQVPVSLSSSYINTVGFNGDPANLLCTHHGNQSDNNHNIQSQSWKTSPCQFQIPILFAAHLKSTKSEVVQVLLGIDAELGSNSFLTAANPPISTALVAMELSTPEGKPISVQDLDSEQAIRVTLPSKYPVELDSSGPQKSTGEEENGTCLNVTLPTDGTLIFNVRAVDELDENAGLYISFNFSVGQGAAAPTWGHVRIEVSATVPGINASHDSPVRECALNLSDPTSSTVESIFLSPILNGTASPLSVNLTTSLVEAGPIHVLVCVFSSLCQYYSVMERRWSSKGLQPLEGSTLREAHCLTHHLTMFGASLFVHPGAVVLLPPPAGPMNNILVVIVCVVLVLIHLVVGLIAHKLDHLDSLRVSQVPLCGRPGLYQYRVLVKTGWRRGAGTTAHVGISLYGVNKSGSRHLQRDGAFQRSSLDQFHLETDDNLGDVWKIRIWHDNTGLDPSWYVQHVVVWDPQTDHMFFFLLNDWLSVENHKNSTVEKEVLASCPEELSEFRRVFISQLMFGMFDHHLWLSLWERPAHSRFTRGQRVTCSALMLHLYLALGALWYGALAIDGHSEPVSAQTLVNMETVAVGMTVAVLLFPLQCFLCFLFRKAHSPVIVDMSVPPSPICHSVEMDVQLGQSELSSPSLMSPPDSSAPIRDSRSSLLESKMFDSSILDFWAASGLAPQTNGAYREDGIQSWPSCDSLLNLPAEAGFSDTTPAPNICKSSPALGPIRQLRRKKALMQLHLVSPSSTDSKDLLDQKISTTNDTVVKANKHSLTTYLTLSEEDLMMSIAAADMTNSNSDSGWDSPRSPSSPSSTSTPCSSWSVQMEERTLCGAKTDTVQGPQGSCPSLYEAGGLYRCSSVDSMASTLLPCPSPSSTRTPTTTRIGVARGEPGWLLPPWAPCVIYPLVALLFAACLAVVGLYGSFWSRSVILMLLISALSAFVTSALLLEPLKVCVQALIFTVLWRPVDPEVEDQLAQETTLVRTLGDHGRKVRPPCGYGLQHAKEEARKVQALRSLMRLLFLLLLLMVNYQDNAEQHQGRLLNSAIRRHLHAAPLGVLNLTSLTDWSDAEQWIVHALVPHFQQNPSLHLVGLPRLQYTRTSSPWESVFSGEVVVARQMLLPDLLTADWSMKQYKTLSIDFTHYHRESGLFVCVSVQLEKAHTERIISSLYIHPLRIPSSFSGMDLQVPLMVLLLISALFILFGETWSMATESTWYLCQCRQWLQLVFALLSIATAILQMCFQSQAGFCISELQSHPDNFINFHSAAHLALRYSQCAAILLTLHSLKLLGTLRFVRRWVVLGRVLQRAWRELWALTVPLMLLLILCIHVGITLFSHSVEDFSSVRRSGVSVLSLLRGRMVLQRLCRMHPVLGPFYGLLLLGGSVWLLAKLCGVALIHAYRAEQAELYRPTVEPQDYEMVEFFIKRLKLWMGLTKAKEFRHRVKFEGMGIPPSRSSQESRLSTLSSTLSFGHAPSWSSSLVSPRPSSSTPSVRSEDSSISEPGSDILPYLDRLLPSVNAMLFHFDQVNQITEDIHNLEMKLEGALERRRRSKKLSNTEVNVAEATVSSKSREVEGDGRKTEHIRYRKTGVFYPKPRVSLPSAFSFTPSTLHFPPASVCVYPHKRGAYSESDSVPFQPHSSSSILTSDTAKRASGTFDLCHEGSSGLARSPRRRAWHSGSSHSADAAQRNLVIPGGVTTFGSESFVVINNRPRSDEGVRGHVSDGVPVKRKAWI